MRRFRKIIKVFIGVNGGLVLVLIALFYWFSQPKSDTDIYELFEKDEVMVHIDYEQFRDFEYRVLRFQEPLDTLKPTVIFIHGAIGSSLDFKDYIIDEELRSKANFISYDRVGYGFNNAGDAQASIAFERDLLQQLIADVPKKDLILVGYSFGGPIALSVFEKIRKVILLAPAVYSEEEIEPWFLNFYKWNATRWLIPGTWVAASKEKITHREDLKGFESNWDENPNKIVSVHGLTDKIVPFANSTFLEANLDKNQFELVPLENTGHALVWTEFSAIKNVFLQELN